VYASIYVPDCSRKISLEDIDVHVQTKLIIAMKTEENEEEHTVEPIVNFPIDSSL
jgi:hypothetical protein